MQMTFFKRGNCYIVRFSKETPIAFESKKNTVIYFNANKNIIGFDVYPLEEREINNNF